MLVSSFYFLSSEISITYTTIFNSSLWYYNTFQMLDITQLYNAEFLTIFVDSFSVIRTLFSKKPCLAIPAMGGSS